MTALFQRIIIITVLFTCSVFSKESEPYLTIMVNNLPLLANTIEVYKGQNVYVDCIAHPSHYSALWLAYYKQVASIGDPQIIDDSISSNIATLNLTNSNSGIYICQSIPTKLQKSIKVVAKKRIKRDDGTFNFSLPEGMISVKDALRLHREILDRYKLHQQKQTLDMEDMQREDERKIAEDEKIKAKKLESVHRTIGITIGLLATGGAILTILYVLRRNANRNLPTRIAAASVPTRTAVEQLQPLNSHTAQSPYRPIETHIPPYPPISVAVRPTLTTVVRPTAPTAVEPETPPPPSYNEVVNNMRPTAPIIST